MDGWMDGSVGQAGRESRQTSLPLRALSLLRRRDNETTHHTQITHSVKNSQVGVLVGNPIPNASKGRN